MEDVVIGELIQGWNAYVYHGEYKGDKCILKFFPTLEEENYYRPYTLEVNVTRMLEPTGIVPRVLDHLVGIQHWDDDELFIELLILEFIPGLTLDKITSLSEDEYERISSQIQEGVNAISSYGIAHNDLKLDNLVYSEGKVFFIDFGSSYDIRYWELMKNVQIEQHDMNTSELEIECDRLKMLLTNTELICPPPECNLEDSISHPGSFYQEREQNDLIKKCLQPLALLIKR